MVKVPTGIAVPMLRVDHYLIVFLVKDLVASNTLALAIAHLSGTAVIHSTLRSSLRRAVLMLNLLLLSSTSVLFRPGKPAWLVLILHGLLVRAFRVFAHNFFATRGCRLFFVDF